MANNIVTASLMANYGVAFNIGADILNKGSRMIEKHLGSEKLSGDTVYVPIMDSGSVYENMDLTGQDLSVTRDAVPVTVRPLTTAAAVSVEDLTLAIDNPEIMSKRVAKMANEANLRAYRTLVSQSQAYVAATNGVEDVKTAAFGAEGYTIGSKLAGNTFGVTHPSTWNRMVASLTANFAPNDRLGSKLYENELGNFMGFAWTKGSEMNVINAVDGDWGNITLTDGSRDFTYTGSGPAITPVDGQLSDPFTVLGVFPCDALGLKSVGAGTGLKTFRARYNAAITDWELVEPSFFSGPRQNCWAAGPISAATYANVLTPGTTYLAPAIIWKEADFLVAVKGLDKFYGSDSFTIPTAYKEKGILPLRGTAWTDPVKASTIFRVDVLMGTQMYQGVSPSAIYIPA